MDRVAPELPSGEPGVEAGEGQITGPGDEQSLFQPGPFSIALGQLGAGEGIESIVVTPGEMDVDASDSTPEGGVWTATLRAGLPPPVQYQAAVPPAAVAFELEVRPVPGG